MHLPGRHFARNLIHRRTLLLQMVRRDFEQRFIGSTAGWMWGLILPLVQLVSWVFVFRSLPAPEACRPASRRRIIRCSCSADTFRGCCFRTP